MKTFVDEYIARRAPVDVSTESSIKILVNPENTGRKREKAYAAIEKLSGNADNGSHIFGRVCASCHKIGKVGYTFGPELTDVGKRLNRHDIVESIIEPSKKVDPKYITTTILTNDGKVDVGFILSKTKDSITLLMAGGKQETIRTEDIDQLAETKQSSMPENLASTLAPSEFLDVVEYLTTRK